MKKMYNFIGVFIICALILNTGCGMSGVALPNRQSAAEDIDPFEYGDEFAGKAAIKDSTRGSVEAKSKTVAVPLKQEKKIQTTDVSRTEEKTPVNTASSAQSTNSFEYRVQIGIFEDRKSADKCREEALSKVAMNVYIEFEAPFYRVRVGDFKTRKEAEMNVKVMQDYGFKGAFWVIKNVANQ
jgi:cell division septation protein DedD